MNKIFLVFSSLDMKTQAQQVYLDQMIKVQAPHVCGSMRSAVLEEKDLEKLQNTLKDFIPKATDFIQREVRLSVPSGRILDVMGTELRFVTSCQLIQRFLDEYYRAMIRDLLENEATLAVPNGQVLQLKSIEIIVRQTKKFFFEDLLGVVVRNKLQPVLETLD